MNTKEAIELCKFVENLDTYGEDNAYVVPNGIPCVIELLQRGEKYEQMWEEYDYHYGELYLDISDSAMPINSEFVSTHRLMDEIKRKYFPKLVKRTISIEIEGGDDIDLGLAKMIMKKALTDWDFKKNIKFKECE